jgi:SAM-dependent methyltransferase
VKSHRWFAAVWDVQTRHEPARLRKLRDEVVGPASGRVLEIGCGAGTNFSYYGDAATGVVAFDPDPHMMRRAAPAAAAASRPVAVGRASAEQLPFATASFDTVVSTWNMCTIRDVPAALAEIKRVLRPGGELRFADHVRYRNRLGGRMQDMLVPVWRWCGAGCHPNRDIAAMVESAGFTMAELESPNLVPPVPPLVVIRPVVQGVARPGSRVPSPRSRSHRRRAFPKRRRRRCECGRQQVSGIRCPPRVRCAARRSAPAST